MITDTAVDSSFQPRFEQVVLGDVVVRSTELDKDLAEELLACSRDIPDFPTLIGHTMCTYDFYEGKASFVCPSSPHVMPSLSALPWTKLCREPRPQEGRDPGGAVGPAEQGHPRNTQHLCLHLAEFAIKLFPCRQTVISELPNTRKTLGGL